MRILSNFEPLDFCLNYESYQYLISVMLNNISYDDGFDLFFSNKSPEALKAPKSTFFLKKPLESLKKFIKIH